MGKGSVIEWYLIIKVFMKEALCKIEVSQSYLNNVNQLQFIPIHHWQAAIFDMVDATVVVSLDVALLFFFMCMFRKKLKFKKGSRQNIIRLALDCYTILGKNQLTLNFECAYGNLVSNGSLSKWTIGTLWFALFLDMIKFFLILKTVCIKYSWFISTNLFCLIKPKIS